MVSNEEIKEQLDRIEASMIAENELRQLGHRIVFDVKTGVSKNIGGVRTDPTNLDTNGYQVRR